ncbi:MAG TPA: sugar phosphate isomerase/epimerase family protein [Bacteroidales bacterium]|nr:sugar phosphate isomerase/epimerase family protein [Bacteroidales bacterium]
MKLKFGVDSFIWSENFNIHNIGLFEKAKKIGFETFDIAISHPEGFPCAEVRKAAKDVDIDLVTTCVLNEISNPLSPDPKIRRNAIEFLTKMVDINLEIGSNIIGGVNYAAWCYVSGKPRTENEWNWSVDTLRKVAEYAKLNGDVVLAFEPVNRFETHFLNIAEDTIKYCDAIGMDNVGVHLDTFHMIREETSFKEAVHLCGGKYLKYVHVCENNRGIPGTGLVPWKEFFEALGQISYTGSLSIESFDPGFEETNRKCAIWRKFADSGEELATKGLHNLLNISSKI